MRKFFRRLSALFHRRRLQREIEAEMAAHREMMPAGRQQHFGSTLRLQEEAADQWGWTWLDQFRQDFAHGARSLGRAPGFALTAIAVLTLGIGVNLAEIHLFNALRHGAGLGVALAAAAAKEVRNILFGFIPFDLVSFGAGLLLFGAVALAASIAPVRRALRIDPSSALRYQ
ncbi:MAG: hypothetical protein LAQ69_01305 [Acidobacteriia bacterium]|nr:hypothetical protein [Terriglobia bacterium]